MRKRVFIIHGWDGYPEEGWFPWLKKELETRGFEVIVPQMPDGDSKPEIGPRVSFLQQLIGNPDENTYLVGHSIGCQTILRYLETLSADQKVGGVVLVAGWFSLTPMSIRTPEEQEVVRPWFETPLNSEKIKTKSKFFTAIFTRDDEYVPIENVDVYREKLNPKIVILPTGGHLGGDSGIKKLPVVLEEILDMSN